jgi:hypothetical protein
MFERKDFATWSEAEAWRKGEAMRCLGYCPVIDEQCYPKCVCYRPAYIHSQVGVSTKYYTVIASGCGHVMISGSINVEEQS